MKVSRLSTREDIEKFHEKWESLASSIDDRHPFLEPEWLSVWLRHLGTDARPYVLTAHSDSDLVGVLPLVLETSRSLGRARMLTFPGHALADYQGILLKEEAPQIVDAFVAFLGAQKDWDLFWLTNLEDGGRDHRALTKAFGDTGFASATLPSLPSPYISISGSWSDHYRTARSNGARKNLERSLRRLNEKGDLVFRHYSTPEDVSAALDETFRLHEARWFDRFTTTPYSRTSARAFFKDLADAYSKKSLLDLSALELNGQAIAFSFSFPYRRRYHYYIPAFDPEYATYSPGSLLMIHLMEKAFDKNLAEFDFMKGDESYKWQWTSTFRANVGLMAANRTLRGRIALQVLSNYHRIRMRARRSDRIRWLRREGLGRVIGVKRRMGRWW